MADVFISYKREDQRSVQLLVDCLRGAGLSLWWDQDIPPEAPWEATIESELLASKVVIVCWSRSAVVSENVKAEARRARNDGRLIQVFVEDCEPPIFFGERQGISLADWRGNADDHRFETIRDACRAIIKGGRPPKGVGYAAKRRTPWAVLAASIAAVSSLVGFVASVGGARETLCALTGADPFCVQIERESGSGDVRATLLQRVEGLWGNEPGQEGELVRPACRDTVRYSIERVEGEDVIVARTIHGESRGLVRDAGRRSIFTRTISPAEEAGQQWEIAPQIDLLTLRDSENIVTTLVRCGD